MVLPIGVSIPNSAKFPPGIDTLEKAYHMNHRGGEIGHYSLRKTGERNCFMECRNPHLCDFDRGILEALAKLFASKGSMPGVTHDPSKPCRGKNGDSCTFLISW